MELRSLWAARKDRRLLSYRFAASVGKWATVGIVGLGFVTTEIGDQVTASHMAGHTPESACAEVFKKANIVPTPGMIEGCAFEKQRTIISSDKGHYMARVGSAGFLALVLPAWAFASNRARRREEELESTQAAPTASAA
jgi:hypothetical protein